MSARFQTGSYSLRGKIAGTVELCIEPPVEHTAIDQLAEQLAMHVVAMNPAYVSRDHVDPATLHKELEIAAAVGRPGNLEEFYRSFCMLEQPSVVEQSTSVAALIARVAREVGATITVTAIFRAVPGGSAV